MPETGSDQHPTEDDQALAARLTWTRLVEIIFTEVDKDKPSEPAIWISPVLGTG